MKVFHREHEDCLSVFYGAGRDDYAQLLKGFASVLEKDVLPRSPQFDLEGLGMAQVRDLLFRQGLCSMPFDSSGGMGLPFGVYALAMELTGGADAGTAMSMAIHNTVAEGIYLFGSREQKEGILADLISGRRLASFALTESSSGSDARAMSTWAAKEGSARYVLNGSKMFITNAGEADLYLVFARTEKGHGAFIVDADTPGLTVGTEIQKLGMRDSRTAEVRFEDCKVAAEDLVGEDGRAFEYAKPMLNASRIVMGAICVGIARLAYGEALDYCSQRRLFDQNLSDFQLTREKLANMRTGISSARLLCLYASRLKDLGVEYASEAAQAKVLATECAVGVCDGVIQLMGGYGYTNPAVHRHWRDARLLTIGEGASEVLRLLIASKELAGVTMSS